MWRRLALVLLGGCAATPVAEDTCSYDRFEGTCVLTDLWVGEGHGGSVSVEAQYDTPRGTETVRHRVDRGDGERLRVHLAKHARVACRGKVITRGTCEPSSLTLELPDLP